MHEDLSAAINARIAQLEDDEFMHPRGLTLKLSSINMGLLLSLAHEGALARGADPDEDPDIARAAIQLVATATIAVEE